MTNLVSQTVLDLWRMGRKTKSSGSGWVSGNAVCCSDKRGRGGIILGEDGSWRWNCFNCRFKTGWRPGQFLSDRNKKLLKLFGAGDDQITNLSMAAMRLREDIPSLHARAINLIHFPEEPLPEGALPIMQALEQHQSNTDLLEVCNTILKRELDIERYYWVESMPTRYIIPFTWDNVNVGWVARSVGNSRPKYLSRSPNGYVYGLDNQHEDWQLMLVCEGVLDADSIDGVAVLGNNISEKQKSLIEQRNRQIIWVADQDETGLKVAEQVLEWGWAVSLPEWQDCKDINDAVVRYGRAATVLSIITAATRNRVAATLRIKQLRNKLRNERTN